MPRSGATSTKARKRKSSAPSIKGVDLFCGAGGLTKGLESAGIDVRLGVDLDPDCEYPYHANNRATFLLRSVEDLSAEELNNHLGDGEYRLLAGCAPCQPFSTYQQGRYGPNDDRWNLLQQFARLAIDTQPDFVTMENVPRLAEQDVFAQFVEALEADGYIVSYKVVNCADYRVPQQRNRLVLLASRHAPIKMIPPITPEGKRLTVRNAIEKLPSIGAGEECEADPLHQACSLSPLNLKRIKASKPGGTWRDWDDDLVAACHKRDSGKTYPSVYGRMTWDDPAPTMTTQYYGFGNGRFGHPEQNRAISLREGAILQSFPKSYKFVPKKAPIYRKSIGRLIGNAVPVNLGKAIGKSIVLHVKALELQRKTAS